MYVCRCLRNISSEKKTWVEEGEEGRKGKKGQHVDQALLEG
jgi:hypothetical protein